MKSFLFANVPLSVLHFVLFIIPFLRKLLK